MRRQPLSAYSLDRAVRSHSVLFRGLGRGNIYTFVARLAEFGYLETFAGKAKRGPSSSKLMYSLTRKGEERFRELLDGVLYDTEASDSSLEIALVLLGQLKRSDAVKMLTRRNKELSAQERRLKRLYGDEASRSAPRSLASAHALSRLQNEQRFVRDMLRLLKNARWHAEWA